MFRVDVAPLLRGHIEPGEVCEIPGVGPIDLATARRYLPDAIVDFVVHHGVDVKAVAHAKRKANRTQLAALLSRDYVCEVEGCDGRRFLEIDHIDPYARTRRTDIGDLGYKCKHSHHLKTHHGWTDGPLQPNGKRQLIPPRTTHHPTRADGSQAPRHAHAPRAATSRWSPRTATSAHATVNTRSTAMGSNTDVEARPSRMTPR